MKYWWPALMFVVCILSTSEALAVQKEEGIVKIPSHHSVDETVDKLKAILQSKGVTLFALVDHSGEAEKVGMKMPPTKLLIFGNPKGGTPLMLAAPSVAIDLPLKILVARRFAGKGVDFLQQCRVLERAARFAGDLLPNIAVVRDIGDRGRRVTRQIACAHHRRRCDASGAARMLAASA